MRTSIKAGPGKILFAIDYSGVELRIVTNLSNEPKWVDEFFRCSGCDHRFEKGLCPPHFCPSCWSDKIGDLHTLTALAIYGEDAATKSDFKLKRQNSKCVHPDTLIRMDSGYTRIGDLTFGGVDSFKPHSGKVLTPKGAFAPILETYNGGVKPLYHVISRRGVLTCSEEHKFLLADGTQKSLSSGLKAGDTLHTPVSFAAEDQEPKALSHKAFVGVPEMAYTPTIAAAYFSGLHAGDGASSTACATITHGSVEKTDALGVRYSEWQEIIMAACRDVGLEPIARKKNVYLGSRHMLRWMQTLGLVDGDPPTKRTLRVPRWILQSGKSAMAHYLGGLIDTDGTVTRGGDISICTKDFVFAGQIAEIIRAIGGEATITTSWNKKYSRWYVKVGFKRRDGALIAPYMRHPGKLARISGTSKSYDRVGNDVLLVIPAGESLCLDLHIDSEDHLYAANGLAVHNSLNFAMCYGGGGSAAQRSVGVDKEEGWRIKRQFDKSYRGLAKWWEEQHKTARKQKYVTTAYGRKYPLPDIDHTDGGFRSKAERNSVNGPVQGTSADIMKFAMGLIYRECKDRGWLDRAKMCVTIHDELVFEIDEDLAEEAVIVINELMTVRTVKNLGWIIPLKNDIEFGEDWTVPFNLVAMTNPRETKPEVWTERWQRVFPKFYADYLANGGTGEIKAVVEAAPVAEPIKDVPEFTVPLSSQSRHVYTIPAHRLTPELAEVLARVVSKCIGRGKEEIVIETDRGLDLLGFPFKASFAEFKIIAGYEGL
jgi:hypothetical protein